MDDTFLLFHSIEHLEKFKKYLNKHHGNIALTSEIEQKGLMLFLDIKIGCKNNKFVTSVYQNPTFSGVLANFGSFLSRSYKYSLIDTLLYRGFSLEDFIRKLVL